MIEAILTALAVIGAAIFLHIAYGSIDRDKQGQADSQAAYREISRRQI